jgi:hypothetical protein
MHSLEHHFPVILLFLVHDRWERVVQMITHAFYTRKPLLCYSKGSPTYQVLIKSSRMMLVNLCQSLLE